MIDVREITQLHQDMVERWHHREVDNLYDGLLGVICKQCSFDIDASVVVKAPRL
jgi:hypothetical protein